MDFDEVRKRASRPTRTVPLYLDGEAVGELEELERQLESAPAPKNLGDGTRREIAERILEVQQRLEESLVTFKLMALPVRGEDSWILLVERQPTRAEGESAEVWQGRIFPWYAEMVSRTVIDPAMSVEQVCELVDLLHQASWNTLAGACLDVNGRKVDVPNSAAASVLTSGSDET
jgi:hypothetical protein